MRLRSRFTRARIKGEVNKVRARVQFEVKANAKVKANDNAQINVEVGFNVEGKD